MFTTYYYYYYYYYYVHTCANTAPGHPSFLSFFRTFQLVLVRTKKALKTFLASLPFLLLLICGGVMLLNFPLPWPFRFVFFPFLSPPGTIPIGGSLSPLRPP